MCWADLFISIDWADYTITTIEALSLVQNVVSSEREIEDKIIKTGLIYFTYPDAKTTSKKLLMITKQKDNFKKTNLKTVLKDYRWDIYCKNLLNSIYN